MLVRDPANSHDANAVLACLAQHDIGFLRSDDAAIIAPALDANQPYTCAIHRIKGGVKDAPTQGVEIAIVWGDQKIPQPVARDGAQERSRIAKAQALDRKRDDDGSFATEKSGCLTQVFFGAIALPLAVNLI